MDYVSPVCRSVTGSCMKSYLIYLILYLDSGIISDTNPTTTTIHLIASPCRHSDAVTEISNVTEISELTEVPKLARKSANTVTTQQDRWIQQRWACRHRFSTQPSSQEIWGRRRQWWRWRWCKQSLGFSPTKDGTIFSWHSIEILAYKTFRYDQQSANLSLRSPFHQERHIPLNHLKHFLRKPQLPKR